MSNILVFLLVKMRERKQNKANLHFQQFISFEKKIESLVSRPTSLTNYLRERNFRGSKID